MPERPPTRMNADTLVPLGLLVAVAIATATATVWVQSTLLRLTYELETLQGRIEAIEHAAAASAATPPPRRK